MNRFPFLKKRRFKLAAPDHTPLSGVFCLAPSRLAWGVPLKQRHIFGSGKRIISTNLPSNTQRETHLGLGRILTLGGTVAGLLRLRQLLEGSRAESRGCEIIHHRCFCSCLPIAIVALIVQALPHCQASTARARACTHTHRHTHTHTLSHHPLWRQEAAAEQRLVSIEQYVLSYLPGSHTVTCLVL